MRSVLESGRREGRRTKTKERREASADDVRLDPSSGVSSVEVYVKGNEGRVIAQGRRDHPHIETTHGVKIEMKRDRGVAAVSGADARSVRRARDAAREVREKGEARGPAREIARDRARWVR